MKSITVLFIALFITFSSIAQENKSEHKAFLDKVFQLLEQRVANPRWLEEDSFIKFKHHMYAEETLNLDEKEFYLTFNRQCKTLSFTHFYLKKVKSTTTASEGEIEKLSWKKMNDSTAYLDVRSFAGGARQMYQALQEIGTDTFENLIIDLRDNGGGSLDAPVILGQFLTPNPIDAGVYLTRGWYTNHTKPATAEEITSLPFLMDFTYAGISKMFMENPAFRMVVPSHNNPTFKGKVYVLINENTASACEPLIYLLKEQKIATLVGTPSAGAMLSGASFGVNENFDVFIPIADYQTYKGSRLDKVGVAPDVYVESDKALEYILEKLNLKSK